MATTTEDRPGTATVRLLSFGGDTGIDLNSYVFGNAPPGAVTVTIRTDGVQVVPESVNVAVKNGVWLVGLHQKDATPDSIHWTFAAANGAVIEQGVGIKT